MRLDRRPERSLWTTKRESCHISEYSWRGKVRQSRTRPARLVHWNLRSSIRPCHFRMDCAPGTLMAEKGRPEWHNRLAGVGLGETTDSVIKGEGSDRQM